MNDHTPVVLFPTKENNTVEVSPFVHIDYVITKVKAMDKDDKNNAKLEFYLKAGNEEGYFRLDVDRGDVIVARDMSLIKNKVFDLVIGVKDRGEETKSVQVRNLIKY